MEWQKRYSQKPTIIAKVILILGLILINIGISVIGGMGAIQSEKGTLTVFYGSQKDKILSQMMAESTGREVTYYNISKIQGNQSFIFENSSVSTIWWINELSLPLDLSFLGDIDKWIQMDRGLFVLNRYFNETPLQDLAHLGITTYAPIVYPINGSFEEQELSLVEEQLPRLNLNRTLFGFTGSTAWIGVDNRSTMIAEIEPPKNHPVLNDLKSGIWAVDDSVIVCSFSVRIDSSEESSRFVLQGINLPTLGDMVGLLTQLAQLTITNLPLGGASNLQLTSMDQFVAMGFFAIASLISIFTLMKIGAFSKIREILMGVFTGLVLFFAHVAYSPQRRRISESELLDNQLRGQIIDYLELKGEQGAHLREIQREIQCGISSLLWHLQTLDDFNFVTHEKIGKYHIFYLTGLKSIQTSELALALKSDVAKELCRMLISRGKPLPLSKISQEINVHHSSIQHHIKKLSELGIIIPIKEKKRSMYIIGPKQLSWLKNHLEVA
ncbi:MAG: HTH domain-containing protein [Candidatus Heimdallarchaeota archaeon]|nr:MAG: HTH domain-containing protein [Candidatus Heimdallarchaeota archaeon]